MANIEEQLHDRLDRLESKIDKLADAMIALARTEEKILTLEEARIAANARLDRQSEKLDKMAERVADNERVVGNIVKLTWVIIPIVLGVAAKIIFGV
jgi:phage I-like protein